MALRWTFDLLARAPLTAARPRAEALARDALAGLDASEGSHDQFGERARVAITERFEAELGPLSRGWCWARDEGTYGGGVVSSWCCVRHTIPKRGPSGRLAEAHVEQVARAAAGGLEEWFVFLRAIRAEIMALDAPRDERQLGLAVSRLTDAVMAATGCGDAWYHLAALVVGWYLARHGFEAAEAMAAEAMSGRFHSWVGPAEGAVEEVVVGLRGLMRHAELDRIAEVDALPAHVALGASWWLEPDDVRARLEALGPLAPDLDLLAAHRRAIGALDEPRGAARADAMRAALALVAAHARSDAALDLPLLAAVHARAMGRAAPSEVRTKDAFAKSCADRYGMLGREALDPPIFEQGLPPCLECARLYLDVLFFHPFDDGNARLARLAVAWLDIRHRIGFADLVPVFTVPRVAGDDASRWGLARAFLGAAEAARKGAAP